MFGDSAAGLALGCVLVELQRRVMLKPTSGLDVVQLLLQQVLSLLGRLRLRGISLELGQRGTRQLIQTLGGVGSGWVR